MRSRISSIGKALTAVALTAFLLVLLVIRAAGNVVHADVPGGGEGPGGGPPQDPGPPGGDGGGAGGDGGGDS